MTKYGKVFLWILMWISICTGIAGGSMVQGHEVLAGVFFGTTMALGGTLVAYVIDKNY